MTAVDTSVLVRLLTKDDPKQTEAARSLFAAGPIWIAKTVLLETRWVLRSTYRFDDITVRDALTSLLGLPNVHRRRISGGIRPRSYRPRSRFRLCNASEQPPGRRCLRIVRPIFRSTRQARWRTRRF